MSAGSCFYASKRKAVSALAAWLVCCAACDDTGSSGGDLLPRRDAGTSDATLRFFDGGMRPDPFAFDAADPAVDNPSQPEMPEPLEPKVDAGRPPPPAGDCLAIEVGEQRMLEGELNDDSLWQRIAPDVGCPANLVTAREVAYKAYVLCPSESERTLDITMLGADLLSVPQREAVADPLLAVYQDEAMLHDDPFHCLAVNDDGLIGGALSDSSRIEGLNIPVLGQVVVIATSFDEPSQRGIGDFALELSAR